jgi:hypothetical protein
MLQEHLKVAFHWLRTTRLQLYTNKLSLAIGIVIIKELK